MNKFLSILLPILILLFFSLIFVGCDKKNLTSTASNSPEIKELEEIIANLTKENEELKKKLEIPHTDSENPLNIYKNLNFSKAEEIVENLITDDGVFVERILSMGQSTDWYDQEENEIVFLLNGEAKLEYEDGKILELKKGDYVLLKAHEVHRVAATSDNCIWLCFFY